MKKLKVINSYTDKELSRNMTIGQEIEVTDERAKVLIDKDFCIDVTEEVIEFESLTDKQIEQPKQKITRNRNK